MDRLLREEAIFPDKKARSLLQALRRKRRFTSMGLLAEAFLQSGLRTSQVRRQYAQALIDQGMQKGAEEYLRRLLEDPETNDSEQAEAHGLLGRIYKQLYVNEYTKANPARAERNLQGAFDEYALSYREDPRKNNWHGINMVALLARAERDRIALNGAVDYKQLAQSILDTLSKKEEEEADGLPAWDLATQIEAHVALGEVGEATAGANNYADAKGTDDFEISSTLRQLIEVWQLKNTDRPGDELIPILRAAQLFQEGGGQTVPLQEARQDLEKVFGG